MVGPLKSEFKVASSFDHPNILKYEELLSNKKNAYFTMELFNAPNLKTQLYNDIRSVHIRLKRLVELVAIARAHPRAGLGAPRHQARQHSDEQVVGGAGHRFFARLPDGRHHLEDAASQAIDGEGDTDIYRAEQILGKPLTPQTDIYNFGVTLFELLTGETPFKGSTPRTCC